MALDTYGELKMAVADWLDRPDLEARIPDLMALARSRIHHGRARGHAWPSAPLRVRAMEAEKMLPAGQAIAARLPDDFLGVVRLLARTTADAPGRPFAYLPPEAWHGGSARCGVYTIEGVHLRAADPGDARLHLRYWRAFAPLAEDGDGDWLLENAPGIYLYAALLEAAPYLRADQRLPLWAGLYAGAVDACVAADRMAAAPAEGLRMRVAGAAP